MSRRGAPPIVVVAVGIAAVALGFGLATMQAAAWASHVNMHWRTP